jgi:hypothetical protein
LPSILEYTKRGESALLFDVQSTDSGFHELLADVYGENRHINDILLESGLDASQINTLRTDSMFDFYDNVKYALYCRFLHYSGGKRLLEILCRRYGLFAHKAETLQETGDAMQISRERVRQLETKAIRRLRGGVSADAVAILLLVSACKTLGISVLEILKSSIDGVRMP